MPVDSVVLFKGFCDVELPIISVFSRLVHGFQASLGPMLVWQTGSGPSGNACGYPVALWSVVYRISQSA